MVGLDPHAGSQAHLGWTTRSGSKTKISKPSRIPQAGPHWYLWRPPVARLHHRHTIESHDHWRQARFYRHLREIHDHWRQASSRIKEDPDQ